MLGFAGESGEGEEGERGGEKREKKKERREERRKANSKRENRLVAGKGGASRVPSFRDANLDHVFFLYFRILNVPFIMKEVI